MDTYKDEVRPILDSEFEFVHLGDNLIWLVKIGYGLFVGVWSTLIESLQGNANLFSISPHEIPGVDPCVAWCQLNKDPIAYYTSKRRRRQSPWKVEATISTVKGLFNAIFISKVKYMEWLSYIVLGKKSSENGGCMLTTQILIGPTRRILTCS